VAEARKPLQSPPDSRVTSPSDEKLARRKRAEAVGWRYYHSETLGIDYRVRISQGKPEMQTEDGVEYDADELAVLAKGGEVPRVVHVLKKVFGGDVVECGVPTSER
jgi:hypothetical protein